MRLLYQGLLRSPASWARVGRGYIGAFRRLGADFAVVAPRGFRHDPSFSLPEGLREFTAQEARCLPPPDVGLGFLHPPVVHRLIGRKKVDLFVWESDLVPSGWVGAFESGVDLVVVPSVFTRDALLHSGLPPEKVAVVPYGHDVGALPEGHCEAGGRPFTFLSIVAPHERKGIRQLLRAYRKAFRSDDGVLLRLKSTYDPAASRRRLPFEIPGWREVLTSSGLTGGDGPPVDIDLRTLADAEMPQLYRDSDVYVQASWGESFGLALLDALALGVPSIATGWGGHMDFFPAGDDALPYRIEPAGGALYEPTPGAQVAIPDEDALAKRLRWHRDHPAASRAIGSEAREAASGMTWLESARRLLHIL